MSNIFIPIDSSDLSKAIPEGEDIIYSTLCKGEGTVIIDNKKYFWNSHLLMTKKGMYFKIPLNARYSKKQIKKLEPKLEVFAPWYNISNVATVKDSEGQPSRMVKMLQKYGVKQQKEAMISVAGVETGSGIGFYCTLYLIRDPNFETQEKYYERLSELKKFIDNLRVPIRLEIAKYLHTKFDEDPKYKNEELQKKYPGFGDGVFRVIKTDWKKKNGPGASLA